MGLLFSRGFGRTTAFWLIWSLFSVLSVPAGAQVDTYRFERMWPNLPQPWYFNALGGIALAPDGTVCLTDAWNHRVLRLTAEGVFLGAWGSAGGGPGEFDEPRGVAVSSAGEVYVVDTRNHRVQRFSADGAFVSEWGGFGSGPGEFQWPEDIALSTAGEVYVTDSANSRVQRFTAEGEFISDWGGSGIGPGEFDSPLGIAISGSGNVYVADAFNERVQRFTAEGEFISEWGSPGGGPGQFEFVGGLAVTESGSVYVVDSFNHRVQRFTAEGAYLSEWGGEGRTPGRFDFPIDIAVSASGTVYVAGKRVQLFTGEADYVTEWGSLGTAPGKFTAPEGVAVSGAGEVYVADSGNHRVQRFTGDGAYISEWGGHGAGPGAFDLPAGIDVSAGGDVYVVDFFNHRVQQFTSDGAFTSMWGGLGDGPGEFEFPVGVAVSGEGDVYIADTWNDRVQRFDAGGEFVGEWGGRGSAPGEFWDFFGLAVSGSGEVYAADTGNDRIQRFTAGGEFIAAWGAGPDAAFHFNNPSGIAISGVGDVFVADTLNQRVLWTTAEGGYVGEWGKLGTGPDEFAWPRDVAADPHGNVYVVDTHYDRVQKFRRVVLSEAAKAVVVAGKKAAPDHLWPTTQASANFAYWALLSQGFAVDEIHYLSPNTNVDITLDGESNVAGPATLANLEYALTQWAPAPVEIEGEQVPAGDVVVYMANHGGLGRFWLDGSLGAQGLLEAEQLGGWLDALEAQIQGRLVIIIDACQSGSFLPHLEGPERIVIASSRDDELAAFQGMGTVSFSRFFWSEVFNGLNVGEAFEAASAGLSQAAGAVVLQTPQLSDPQGLAPTTFIGNGTPYLGDRPGIGAVWTEPEELAGGTSSATVAAELESAGAGVSEMWAIIQPPDLVIDDPAMPLLDLPRIPLQFDETSERWEGTYDGFNTEGVYAIRVFARDQNFVLSPPAHATLAVNNPLRRRALIVAGGAQSDPYWPAIENAAGTAYRALRSQGYPDSDLLYYSATATPGVDGLNARSNLVHALTQWAATDTRDLVVYLVGRGGGGVFHLNPEEPVLAAELAGWLDGLQGQIPGRITVVYDAHQAGSFLDALAAADGSAQRTVIASAGAFERAVFKADGAVCFSSYFWPQILSGAKLGEAFNGARAAMLLATERCQDAILADEGGGVPSQQYQLGAGIRFGNDEPVIGEVMEGALLEGNQSALLLWVDGVASTRNIERVFAVVREARCHAGEPEPWHPDADALIVELEQVGPNRYERHAPAFSALGEYEVTFFAEDEQGNVSEPQTAYVVKAGTQAEAPAPGDVVWSGIDADDLSFELPTEGSENWAAFYAWAPDIVTIQTLNLGPRADLLLELYQVSEDGRTVTLAASDDNGGIEPGTDTILFAVPEDALYFVRATYSPDSPFDPPYGDGVYYSLRIWREAGPTEPGSIRVQVSSRQDDPVLNAQVCIPQFGARCYTAVDGQLNLGSVHPGGYSVRASRAPEYGEASGSPFIVSGQESNVILQLPRRPEAADDTYELSAGASLEVAAPGVLENDFHPDGGTTVALVAAPQHGNLTLNPDGSFMYTHTNMAAALDTFTYHAINPLMASSPSEPATVTLHAVSGTLRVNIAPPEAVAEGAQWRVDGGAWHESGDVISIGTGTHSVEFSEIPGWTTPDSQAAEVVQGQTATVSGVYERHTGMLTVVVEPEDARAGGAQWSIDGDTWHDSGHVLTLDTGHYTVSFSEIPGWTTPAPQAADVTQGAARQVTGTYARHTGTLTVFIEPADARAGGAQWSIDGSAWHDSGQDIPLETGDYTVAFSPVAGCITPAPRQAGVAHEANTEVTGTYPCSGESALTVLLTPGEAVTGGAAWSVDGGATWHGHAHTAELDAGTYTVTFLPVEDWCTPEDRTVDVPEGEAVELEMAYTRTRVLDFHPKAGLTLGGGTLTIEVCGAVEGIEVFVGGLPAPLVADAKAQTGQLVVALPSMPPGAYPLRIVDPESGGESSPSATFRYTGNPFDPDLGIAPGELALPWDAPEGMSVLGMMLPRNQANAPEPFEAVTPEGIEVYVPVEALPSGTTNAYLIVRSGARLRSLFAPAPELPPGYWAGTPFADIHILAELNGSGQALEVGEALNEPATLRFPLNNPCGIDEYMLGRMETNLDEQFRPTTPEPARIELYAAPLAQDEDGKVRAEAHSFTVYGLLDPAIDVNRDGDVNALDIQTTINAALGIPAAHGADVNCDGHVNAVDIQQVINAVLGIQ